MSTFMQKKESVVRKWYVIDAAEKPLGKTAVAAADLLRGKNDPTFTPHVDCGNFVIIVNAEKAVLTGNKMTDKYYYHHSGYIGGMKKVQYKTLMATKPERAGSQGNAARYRHRSQGIHPSEGVRRCHPQP